MMVHLNCCSSLVFEEKGLELIAVIRMQQGKNPVNEYEQKEDPREEVGRHFALSDRPRQPSSTCCVPRGCGRWDFTPDPLAELPFLSRNSFVHSSAQTKGFASVQPPAFFFFFPPPTCSL